METSLQKLGLDCIDLYLIHHPFGDYYGAWRAMEELYAEGKIRAIGVDNFTQEKLADFLFWQHVKPAVNLVECNPFFQHEDDLRYMRAHGVQMQAWSPLSAGQSSLFQNGTLLTIAQHHQRSAAQIALRFLTQRGIVPLVKSANPQRMRENLDCFDFMLTEAEMAQITSLDTGHSCFPPRQSGASVEAFLQGAVTFPL